ncbi:MAG: NAD(P)-binding domain-containing protein [Candidatus Acidiferrales bacterium]
MIDIAIVGAGPYGLSLAAHLRPLGVRFRIFGRAMDSWLDHMPKGMMLKSEGFASNIYDPEAALTLGRFCADRDIQYADSGIPVRLDTFSAYGLAFRERFVPDLETKLVANLKRIPGGFLLRLDNGETVAAARVVLAVGITHFAYIPPVLSELSAHLLSHSFRQHDLSQFKGRRVTVIGAGSSATDVAGLLHENGANVDLVARCESLFFHNRPVSARPRPLWQRLRHPSSGLGPGLRSRLYTNVPQLFRHLPQRLRTHIVRTHLGPSGGWFAREKVEGKVPLQLGVLIEKAEAAGDEVCLYLRSVNGTKRELRTGHVIAATGYKVDVDRLKFLSDEVRSSLRAAEKSPMLSSNFESSVKGLYFIGVAAANSFGPMLRFAYGAGFAARRLSQALAKSQAPVASTVRDASAVRVTE